MTLSRSVTVVVAIAVSVGVALTAVASLLVIHHGRSESTLAAAAGRQ